MNKCSFFESGSTEVIHTFNYYIQDAVTSLQAKGAIPIVSSQTPDNIWNGSSLAAAPRFVAYASEAASRTGAAYVDHYDYVAQARVLSFVRSSLLTQPRHTRHSVRLKVQSLLVPLCYSEPCK